MAIALTLKQYLDDHAIDYDVVKHRKTSSSASTALATHVSGECLAKAVVVKRKDAYLLVIVPASRQVELKELSDWLKQPVSLASEEEISDLFPDCDIGAIPPVAAPYGLKAVVDESIEGHEDIYFEGGDHRSLVHLSGTEFGRLMQKCPHQRFSV